MLPPPPTKYSAITVIYLSLLHVLAISAFFLPIVWHLWPVMLGIYLMGGFGTTVGYHRLIAHRAFACPKWLEYALVTGAMINTPGSPLLWVANHRSHHGKSDQIGDPHSPNFGIFYAHVGWICNDLSTETDAHLIYCKDIANDAYYQWLLRNRMLPQVFSVVAMGLIFGPLLLPQLFFLPTVAWMNSTFAVNSFSHVFGSQPFVSRDRSRNFWPVGVLALGEGWHNNHHAFPSSARHGLQWYQLDLSWLLIRALQAVGLAWDIKLPTAGQMAARSVGAAPGDDGSLAESGTESSTNS